MRIVKTIGIVLGLLLALILVIAAIAPKDFNVEKATTIEASADAIFSHVKYFEKRNAWYPWGQDDPTNKTSIEGDDGTVGAISHWEGETTGKGKQVITLLEENKRFESDLIFLTPYESEAATYMTLEKADAGTEVKWGFNTSMPYPMNLMGMFMDWENGVGKDFTKGLNLLKTIVEEEKANTASTDYNIMEVDLPTRHFLAVKEEIEMDKLTAHYAKNLPKVAAACQKNKIEMAGMPCGLFYSWDIETNTTEVAQAVPVSQKVNLKGFTTVELPAGKGLQVDYYGDYHGTITAHEAIEAYCKAKGLTPKMPVIEQYVTDPEEETDQSKWLTRIYYALEE